MLNQTPLGQITWRKSSVDAHGLSSHLGCSRILWHLISFLNHQRTPTVLAEKANHQMTTHLQRKRQIEHDQSFVWDACPIQLNKAFQLCSQPNLTWTVVRTSRAQSDEGCRRNFFNISRKKGVGYLRVVIAARSQNDGKYKQKDQTQRCLQLKEETRNLWHINVKSNTTWTNRLTKVLSRRAWFVFTFRM